MKKFDIEKFTKDYPLNMQLYAVKKGDFEMAWMISEYLRIIAPENHRAAYNRGLYLMMQGHLLEGMKHLARGRFVNAFGEKKPNTDKPIWSGQENQIVILYLENGLGDQIYQLRYVKELQKRNCKVIVACSDCLKDLFLQQDYVEKVISVSEISNTKHDSWLPGMSAPIPLEMEYKDVSGEPYIKKAKKKSSKFTIGLRWQGNPEFEHDHQKYFNPNLFFDAVKGHQVEYISLQRDEGSQHKPEWVKQHNLDTWIDTKEAVSQCDLVISSCTSVAHLSAAMGVQTWIIIPVMPYFLWATAGEKSEWYDSVRLFRQDKKDSWDDAFKKLKSQLNKQLNEAQNARLKLVG